MAKDLAAYFGDKIPEKKETGKCMLPGILFKARNDAHISHLLQNDKTLARHNAFAYFYETIEKRLDRFVETYMAMNELNSIVVPESKVIEEPISYFNDLYAKVQQVRPMHPEPYMLAQLDVIDTVIMQTLYMFKNITT